MVKITYPLYDTAVFGTTASVENVLFQVAQGATAAATKSFTNSRGAGQLPNNESFECNEIHAMHDANVALADSLNVWILSYLEFRVNDETLLLAPLRMFASKNSFGGHYSEVTPTAEAAIGLVGSGFMLPTPIIIPGGVSFRVSVFQGTALATANQAVRVVLNGTLTRT